MRGSSATPGIAVLSVAAARLRFDGNSVANFATFGRYYLYRNDGRGSRPAEGKVNACKFPAKTGGRLNTCLPVCGLIVNSALRDEAVPIGVTLKARDSSVA